MMPSMQVERLGDIRGALRRLGHVSGTEGAEVGNGLVTPLPATTTRPVSQHVQKAIDAHTEAVAFARSIGRESVTAVAHFVLSVSQFRACRLEDAGNSVQQAITAALGAGSTLWAAWARSGLAYLLFEQGKLAEAAEAISEVLRDPLPNPRARAECLWIQAMILRETGQIEQAGTSIGAAIRLARDQHIAVPEADFEIERGKVLLAAGESQEALAVLQKAAATHQHFGDRGREATALDAAGEACQALARFDEAADLHRRAATRHGEIEDPRHQAIALANLARALHHLGAADEAARQSSFALQLLAPYDDPRADLLRSHITGSS